MSEAGAVRCDQIAVTMSSKSPNHPAPVNRASRSLGDDGPCLRSMIARTSTVTVQGDVPNLHSGLFVAACEAVSISESHPVCGSLPLQMSSLVMPNHARS